MTQLYDLPDPHHTGERLLSTRQRGAVLDHQITMLTRAGYYLLTRFDHSAVVAREQSTCLLEIFIDEFGGVHYP